MDVFRRQKFNEAMFAKNRTLAIRVGQYQSRDINEASFDYGYIKGDTYKPGGTCAGSAKIVFASVITSFNKLDKIYPEIGLLVDGTYEWVKMGEYFINDIEIDRNRKTTKLDLMDGMFKLNREHVTDLTYPAEIRNVIKEICLKTGIELANENMGLASMNYRIEQIPKDKKMTFRDVLSLATQMLGMSCFFNREGKLEIKELTDSGIVITADSYFMHGLTKSEIEYQIAGITCKKDKETLTVGLRTGRSLELDNLFMSQSILDNLYHNIKDIRYYPFSLNYQGHLLLDVGQWVTIKTNTGETFKSPVLSQSFNFKGGLRGRISADSKAGNDAQYSYAGTITKKIEQFNEFEAQLQNQIEEADRGFDAKVDQIKKDFNDQIELTKAKAEENKKALSDEIDRRFHEFSPAGFDEAKRKAEEALKKAGASDDLAQEAKRIASENQITFTSIFDKVNRQENELAEYKETVSERIANLSSRIANKADDVNFQRVKETAQLYERILGSSESDISRNASRLVMSNQVFQTEVGKYVTDDNNLVVNSMTMDKNTLVGNNNPKASVSVDEGVFTIKAEGLTGYNWTGFTLPIYVKKIYRGETYTLGFKFRIRDYPDSTFAFNIKNHGLNKILLFSDIGKDRPLLGEWMELQKTFTVQEDFAFGEDYNYPFYIYLAKNGWVEFKEPILVRGSKTGPYKPSQFDDAYKMAEATQTQVTQKLAEYKETSDGRFATISTQISGKADQSDFQRVKETSQLYERILGTNDSNVSTNIARMALTSELFEVEVGKRFSNLNNLFYAPTKIPKYISSVATDTHLSRVGWGDHDGIRINYTDSMSGWLGVRFPLTKKFVKQGESLGYRIEIAVDKVPQDGRVLIQLLDNTTNLNMYYDFPIPITKTGNQVFTGYIDIPNTGELNEYSLRFTLTSPGNIVIHKPMVVDRHIIPDEFVDSTDYNNEYNRVTMSLLQDSFAIKALNSAGDIISQVNLNSNNALIEANKIRLKGRTLADEITAIDGYFKRLFVGDARIGTLNTDIIRSNSIAADKLIFDTALAKKLVASDVFTDTLAAKTAFINKLRSVVVSATLLEGYKGKIGGFQIGTHDKDPSTYWLTGTNQFAVGMSNGSTGWGQTSLWVNWGDNWESPGPYAWYVKRTGEMFCYNKAQFWNTPRIHGNLEVTGNIIYFSDRETNEGGYWIYSPSYKKIKKKNGYIYFYEFGDNASGDWIPLNKEISDRRYKHNIEDSKVSALEVIDRLKTYSYRKEYDGKIEDISCGIMAQDVQKYAPEAFLENPDGAYSYNTFVLVPYLIKAIQELNQKLEKVNEGRN